MSSQVQAKAPRRRPRCGCPEATPVVISVLVTGGTQLVFSVDPAKGYELLLDVSEELGLTPRVFFHAVST